jgi:hypothetical protein
MLKVNKEHWVEVYLPIKVVLCCFIISQYRYCTFQGWQFF